MKKRQWDRGKIRLTVAIFFGVLLCVAALYVVMGAKDSGNTVGTGEPDGQAGVTEEKTGGTEIKKENSGQKDKVENVYVKADASGAVREITVDTVLKREDGSEGIQDYSTLRDIKNTEGDEEFTREADGTLLWENHGADIHYEGKSDGQLPVSVKISYYLNGKEMKPEQIAGQNGKVRIRFDYENHMLKTVEMEREEGKERERKNGAETERKDGTERERKDEAERERKDGTEMKRKDGAETTGEQAEVYVPFAALSAILLPSDQFSNIQVTNGKVMDIGDQTVVIGYALPGFTDSLKLYEYEPARDVEIPDYVEITADAEDFALDFTATVVTPGLFEDMDLESLEDVDGLVEAMEELTEASKELADGTAELFDGAKTLRGYMGDYTEGVKAIDEGAQALTDGLKMLDDNKAALEEGASALQEGLEAMDEALKGVEIPDEDSGELAPVITACRGLEADVKLLAEALGITWQSLEQLQEFWPQAEAYVQAVREAVAAAGGFLSQADLDAVIAAANEIARQQAGGAVVQALEQSLSANGIKLTEEQKQQLKQEIVNSVDVSDAFTQMKGQLEEAQGHLDSLTAVPLPQLPEDISQLTALVSDMQKQLAVLADYAKDLSGVEDYLKDMEEALEQLKEGAHMLAEGSSQLTEGIGAFNDGIRQLYDGSAALSDGTGQLAGAGDELNEGAGALADGAKALADGMEVFDEEGIKSLAELAGEDLAQIVTRVRAMQKADSGYDNFGGIREGKTGSVRFLIETEEISDTE